ncbi:MAG: phosphate transport system substrate-binding protein [Haloarculaceae archaeon]|jgi:phosphate transport system substrate-binding protein
MTDTDGSSWDRTTSRREFVTATTAAGLIAIAGCTGDGDTSASNGGKPDDSQGDTATVETLEAGGSSTVYPIVGGKGGAETYWNANPAASSDEWPHETYGIETDDRLANYWGSRYGFQSEGSSPPFKVTVSLSHSGTGCEKLRNHQLDIGDSSAPVRAEKPDWSESVYEKFTDHVVGVDGQPLVVSSEIYEQGVTGITGQELKDIYKGRITNWKALGGPDRKIQVLGRVKGSGTRTAFVKNVFGDPAASTTVDNRFGQNQRLAQAIKQADNAISYLALAFLDTKGVTDIALNWKGTTYEYGSETNGLGAKEYPLSRDLHAYTWDGTSKAEAAFLRMVLSDFGQATFVEPNDYFKLPKDRQQAQLDKLPDPSV